MENKDNLLDEIWKDVPDWEGFYQVSSLGRVRSCPRAVKCGPNLSIIKTIESKILSPNSKRGYLVASLCIKSTVKCIGIHRLVALAFLPNTDNKPQVDHINGIRIDNRVSNLRWVTEKENARNPNTRPKALKAIDYAQRSRWKAVKQIDPSSNNTVAIWPSISEAERQTNVKGSAIWACCSGKNRTSAGYAWAYVDESSVDSFGWKIKMSNEAKNNPNYSRAPNKGNSKAVLQLDVDSNKVIARFESATIAAKVLGIHRMSIGQCCKGQLISAGGFTWRLENVDYLKGECSKEVLMGVKLKQPKK